MNYTDRIPENYLKGDKLDGEIYSSSDVNELEKVAKEGINANYYDIQKITNGVTLVGNAAKIDGATVSRSTSTKLTNSDNTIPSSKQVMDFVLEQAGSLGQFGIIEGYTESNPVLLYNLENGLYIIKPNCAYKFAPNEEVGNTYTNYFILNISSTKFDENGEYVSCNSDEAEFRPSTMIMPSTIMDSTYHVESQTTTHNYYLRSDMSMIPGYNNTKTQVLKNINGTVTWVDEI